MAMEWLTGKPEQMQQYSTLNRGQQGLHAQLLKALQGGGAGGAFGGAADYYRDLMDPSGASQQAFQAPMMRQFNEEIVPGLSEQFAGMGSGGLSSSSFRNATVNAGADLSERLAAMRAGLRQQGAQGLFSMGQQGLNPVMENVMRPATGGLLGNLSSGLGQGLGQAGGMAAMMKFLPLLGLV